MHPHAEEIIQNWKILKNSFSPPPVDVDEGAIARYAAELKARGPKIFNWQDLGVEPKDDVAFTNMALVRSAVDFCFAIFDNPEAVDKFSVDNPADPARPFVGSRAMAYCFYRVFGENPVRSADLKDSFTTLAKTEKFFQGRNRMPLLEYRHWIMQEMIDVLDSFFYGDPCYVYEEAKWDGVFLVDCLVRFFPNAFGADISRIKLGPIQDDKELVFRFNKKAKLAAMLYQSRALSDESVLSNRRLTRMSEIIAIEDYQVPRFLHHKKILKYSPALESLIRTKRTIYPNSPEEVLIRGGQTYANSRIFEELNRGLEPGDAGYWDITALDPAEFFEARTAELPHHLTPTTAY